MRASDVAWIAIGAGVAGYELAAILQRDWELLSEAADRYRCGHPVLTQLSVFYLALHLTRRIPCRIDPLHRLAAMARR